MLARRYAWTSALLVSGLTLGCAEEPALPAASRSANFLPVTETPGTCLNTVSDDAQKKLQTSYQRNHNFADVITVRTGSETCEGGYKFTLSKNEFGHNLTVEETSAEGELTSSSKNLSDAEWEALYDVLGAVAVTNIAPEGCQKATPLCEQSIAFKSDYTNGTFYSEDQANGTSADAFVSKASFQTVIDSLKVISE